MQPQNQSCSSSCLQTINGYSLAVTCVVTSPDGQTLISGSNDSTRFGSVLGKRSRPWFSRSPMGSQYAETEQSCRASAKLM